MVKKYLDKKTNSGLGSRDVLASSFWALSGLEPTFFEISGFGWVWVVQNLLKTGGWAGRYLCTYRI